MYHELDLGFQRDLLSFSASTNRKIDSFREEVKQDNKAKEVTDFIGDISKLRNAIDQDPKSFAKFTTDLKTDLESDLGIRRAIFTGANLKDSNPASINNHIDDALSTSYNPGTLARIYSSKMQSEDITYDSYNTYRTSLSEDLLTYYMQEITQNRPMFYFEGCLGINDLILRRYPEQEAMGLEAKILSFLNSSSVYGFFPIKQDEQQFVLVEKVSQKVTIFASNNNPESLQRMRDIIKKALPYYEDKNIVLTPFLNTVSPSYYGTIIVEIADNLCNVKLYDDVIQQTSPEALSVLAYYHKRLFKPSQELLNTQKLVPEKVINPDLGIFLAMNLIDGAQLMHPQAFDTDYHPEVRIEESLIEGIKNSRLALESMQELYIALSYTKFVEKLIEEYRSTAHAVKRELEKFRLQYQKDRTNELIKTVGSNLMSQYNDKEVANSYSNQNIPVKLYWNWFEEANCGAWMQLTGDRYKPSSDTNVPYQFYLPSGVCDDFNNDRRKDADNFLRGQSEQIRHSKDSFLEYIKSNSSSNYGDFFSGSLDIYNQDAFTVNLTPYFIFSTRKGGLILAKLAIEYHSPDSAPKQATSTEPEKSFISSNIAPLALPSVDGWLMLLRYPIHYISKYLPWNKVRELSYEELVTLEKSQFELIDHENTYKIQLRDKIDNVDNYLTRLKLDIEEIIKSNQGTSIQLSEIQYKMDRIHEMILDYAKAELAHSDTETEYEKIAGVHVNLPTSNIDTECIDSSEADIMYCEKEVPVLIGQKFPLRTQKETCSLFDAESLMFINQTRIGTTPRTYDDKSSAKIYLP